MKVKFIYNVVEWGSYAIYIERLINNDNTVYSYHYRKSIANLFDINITKLTKILTEKYNARVYGGKKYHSYYLFNEENIEGVKEYFESLIIMKKLVE